MSVLTQPLRLSINPRLIDKNEAQDNALFKSGWENRALTPVELAAQVDQGVAYCAELSGSRRSANFVCSGLVSVDIDGTKRIPEILADPIVRKHLTIFYTTVSHTEDVHRVRLGFASPYPIETGKEMVAATRSLSLRLSGDRAATDATRIFYGSRGSSPRVFDRGLDRGFLNELIAQGLDADQRDAPGSTGTATTVSRLVVPDDLVVSLPSGEAVPFAALEPGVALLCPFHSDNNASAFTVRSSDGKTMGLRCSTCGQAFWPKSEARGYDFFEFDARVADAQEYFNANKDMGPLHGFVYGEENPVRRGLLSANISITQDRYLSLPQKLPEGIIFIKSPKGTGKTECLSRVLKQTSGSVLLIGHRVSLIRQSCERLGLDCYLDHKGPLRSTRLGICLDSLRRLRSYGSISSFETILIDESEQVLGHFLSDTIDPVAREAIFVDFRSLLQRAKRVVALDADLGWLSFETLSKLSQPESASVSW